MVIVEVFKKENRIILEIKGHSGYGKKGNDIVCAGISAVIQYMIVYFFNILHMIGSFDLKEGYSYLELTLDGNENVKDDILEHFYALSEFLSLLSSSYPGSISFSMNFL